MCPRSVCSGTPLVCTASDRTAVAGTSHTYAARAVNANGVESNSSDAVTVTVPTP
jgi:hypothetical protein